MRDVPGFRSAGHIWFHSNLYIQICHWNIVTLIPPIMQFGTSNFQPQKNFSHNACLVLGVCGPQTLAALPPMMHVWSSKFQAMDTLLHYHQQFMHLVEILGHRNVTKLQLIMHAWYLEFWIMHKNFTFPTMHVWFSKIWGTHTSPQGLIRLSTNTCYFSSALLPWNTNPLGSKGVTILIYIGSQTMQDSCRGINSGLHFMIRLMK